MAYGKANRTSRYLRTHPYRKQPSGSPRSDEQVTIGDVWKALGTIKKYMVSSVSSLLQKMTGVGKKPERKGESATSINGDALRDSSNIFDNSNLGNSEVLSTNTFDNSNLGNSEVFSRRQQKGCGETDPWRQTWFPPYQQPYKLHQSYPYIDERPLGRSYQPLNLRKNPMMSYVSPRNVQPYSYGRPWNSTIAPKPLISNSSNSRPRLAMDSAYKQRDYFVRGIDGKPFRRKLFSWEKYRSNAEFKQEEGSQGESKAKVILKDPSIGRGIDRAEQISVSKTEERYRVTLKRSFPARINRSFGKENSLKRGTFKGLGRRLKFKTQAGLAVRKEESGMDLTFSRCNDVYCAPMSQSVSDRDVSTESHQRNDSCSDKMVGSIEMKDAANLLSATNMQVSPSESVRSSPLLAAIYSSSKPVSSSIFGLDKSTKKSGIFDNVVGRKTFKPEASTGLFGLSEKDPLEINSSANLFSQSEKKSSEKIISVNSSKAKQAEDHSIPKAKPMIEKQVEIDSKSILNEATAVPQKPSKVVKENISFACRMARLKRIKIRDHYIQQIESLYDSKCTEKDKEAKKSKAVSIYRDKYHKLKQDHSFYTKLCTQYNVEPGEEYIGVDPDVKPEDDEEDEVNKKTAPVTFSFKPKVNHNPNGDSNQKVESKPVLDKCHINPFASETTKPANEPPKKSFNFSGDRIFPAGPPKLPVWKSSKEDSSSTNLFILPKKPNLFSGQSITAPTATNPFRPSGAAAAGNPLSSMFKTNPANPNKTLSNTTNGTFKATGSIFGSTSTNKGGVVSMESDAPTGNNNNTFNSSNPFAGKGKTSNTNLFPSNTTSNPFCIPQGGSSGVGLFGNVKNNINVFNTNSSKKRGFGSSGVFNPGNIGEGFTLGKIAGNTGKRKRRPIVRGRRTLG